jgi:hypothetical protein
MPHFVKTKHDEKRWSAAKQAAAKSKGKSAQDLHDEDFKLVNYIYHKMGKSEQDIDIADKLKKELLAPPKPTPTSMPNPMKSGEQSTLAKIPKTKSLSKNESPNVGVKLTSIEKLRNFLKKVHAE